jgi:hypothetical protein
MMKKIFYINNSFKKFNGVKTQKIAIRNLTTQEPLIIHFRLIKVDS